MSRLFRLQNFVLMPFERSYIILDWKTRWRQLIPQVSCANKEAVGATLTACVFKAIEITRWRVSSVCTPEKDFRLWDTFT